MGIGTETGDFAQILCWADALCPIWTVLAANQGTLCEVTTITAPSVP